MGYATIGEWEGRICNTLGSCIQTWDDKFVQTFRGKTSSLKPFVVSVSCVFVAYTSVHGAWECERDATGATQTSFFNANGFLATRRQTMYAPTHTACGMSAFRPPAGAKTDWSTDTQALLLMHQVPIRVHIEDGDSNWLQQRAFALVSLGYEICGWQSRVFLIFYVRNTLRKAHGPEGQLGSQVNSTRKSSQLKVKVKVKVKVYPLNKGANRYKFWSFLPSIFL